MSPEVEQKGGLPVFVTNATSDTAASPSNHDLESNRLHTVARGQQLPDYQDSKQEEIVGYNAAEMQDRNALTSEEEKKLLRRIDFRLLPLLALMYIVKTMDAANVSKAHVAAPQVLLTDRIAPRSRMLVSWAKAPPITS